MDGELDIFCIKSSSSPSSPSPSTKVMSSEGIRSGSNSPRASYRPPWSGHRRCHRGTRCRRRRRTPAHSSLGHPLRSTTPVDSAAVRSPLPARHDAKHRPGGATVPVPAGLDDAVVESDPGPRGPADLVGRWYLIHVPWPIMISTSALKEGHRLRDNHEDREAYLLAQSAVESWSVQSFRDDIKMVPVAAEAMPGFPETGRE